MLFRRRPQDTYLIGMPYGRYLKNYAAILYGMDGFIDYPVKAGAAFSE